MEQTPTLSDIGREIRASWRKPYYGAVPYIDALCELDVPATREGVATAMYGDDSARDVVLRFLSNATSWRGDIARATKAILKKAVGLKS